MGQTQKCGEFKPINGVTTPSDNWMSNVNDNIDINKHYKTCINSLSFKNPNAITKMNDNINMNDTNAGSYRMHASTCCSILLYIFVHVSLPI